jgi:hypothetical protein
MNRWVIHILLSLILGAVICIAVAWGLALRTTLHVNTGAASFRGYCTSLLPDGSRWTILADGGPGVRLVLSYVEGASVHDSLSEEIQRRLNDGVRRYAAPSWIGTAQRQPESEHETTTVCAVATGWPCPSAVAVLEVVRQPRGGGRSEGFELAPRSGIVIGPQRSGRLPQTVLPTQPIWPGMIINTVFYAVLVLAMMLGFSSARRSIRRRHSRCVRCGYRLTVSQGVCPECGQSRWGARVERSHGNGTSLA